MGVHVRRRVHDSVPEERRSGRGDPALQADRGDGVGQGLPPPVGGAMTDHLVREVSEPAPLYRPPVSRLWWVHRRSYRRFVLRELSSIFVAWFVVLLLLFLHAVGQDDAAVQRYLDWAANPFVIALNVGALAFVLLHAVTGVNLAPQAMVVRLRGRRIPPQMIMLSQYAGWAAVSALVAWLLVGR